MKSIQKYRSSIITVAIILGCVFIFTTCINNEKDEDEKVTIKSRYPDYAGTAACVNCHKSTCDSFYTTAHFHSSAIAAEENIKGSFAEGANKYTYTSGAYMAMQKQTDGLYQVGFIKDIERKKQRFDITIGAGTQGQSYGSWQKNNLMQLPITFFTSAHQWSNSPGYPDKIAFNRPITSRCLECHTTYAEVTSAPEKEPEEYDKSRMILSINCERCHGPAAAHVKFQTENPNEKTAKFIIDPSKFSRQQSLDMVLFVTAEDWKKANLLFNLRPEIKLADYFSLDTTAPNVNAIDVHGNQYGLLKASKCFINSKTLTCNSCHNNHANETGNATMYAQKCNSCHADKHTGATCKMTNSLGTEALNKIVLIVTCRNNHLWLLLYYYRVNHTQHRH